MTNRQSYLAMAVATKVISRSRFRQMELEAHIVQSQAMAIMDLKHHLRLKQRQAFYPSYSAVALGINKSISLSSKHIRDPSKGGFRVIQIDNR